VPRIVCSWARSRRIELKTGQWNFDHFGAGTVTLVGDKLFLIREDGELIVALATPKKFRPISRAQLLPATVRSYPAIANGKLYVRNERTLACFATCDTPGIWVCARTKVHGP